MIDYAAEPLTVGLIREIEPLLATYYEKTAASTDIPPYDFDWDTYLLLSRQEKLLTVTARKDGKLVGFVFYLVCYHLHHKTMLIAQCDGIAVDMDCRGAGIGRGLFTEAEAILKDVGVVMITNNYRVCYNTQPLFEKLGFTVMEHVYMKKV